MRPSEMQFKQSAHKSLIRQQPPPPRPSLHSCQPVSRRRRRRRWQLRSCRRPGVHISYVIGCCLPEFVMRCDFQRFVHDLTTNCISVGRSNGASLSSSLFSFAPRAFRCRSSLVSVGRPSSRSRRRCSFRRIFYVAGVPLALNNKSFENIS